MAKKNQGGKEEDKGKDIALRYIGGGSYLPFVPARDLTAEEAEKHKERLDEAKQSGAFALLYVPVDEKTPATTAESEVSNG